MKIDIIKKIFFENNVEKVENIEKINIGFTNEVYSINDKLIIKICENNENEENFEKEAFFYELLRDKIPVPNVIIYDNSKKIYNKSYIIYAKIQGDNLYSKWHLINDENRENIIKELCNFLKIINNQEIDEYIKKFNIKLPIDWKGIILDKIYNSLNKINKNKIISKNFISKIEEYIENNKYVLDTNKLF